jgi:diaminohydroxyphosphoribosylaminopyrimidine deaminase/5-amino-6-(5-phosphoribosylamino)uracil reductase
MRQALAEARKGLGRTSPNPAVGAVLLRQNRILARGHHQQAGSDHAEVDCLRKISGPVPSDAVLFVTLEPCSTHGRTGPCVDYLRERKIRHVVIGAIDPNPKHKGRAITRLRAAGIRVTTGVLAEECTRLNEAYNKWIVNGEPFVIAKCGMSLDGRLTRPGSEQQWITSAKSRADAQRLRPMVDAILVGAETIRRDNPRLTARGRFAREQPWRVVLTRSGRLPRRSTIFNDRYSSRTLVPRAGSLRKILRELGAREITSVLIEGGGQILTEALEERLIDKLQIYLGPFFTGGGVLAFGGRGAGSAAEALRLHQVRYERIGHDICVSGYLGKTSSGHVG